MQNKNNSYNGNPLVVGQHYTHNYTSHEISEFAKCYNDPIYFIETYIKIITLDKGIQPFLLWDYQKKMVNNYYNNQFSISLTARQMGKSVTVAAVILHHALFNEDWKIAILANKSEQAKTILGIIKNMYERLPKWLQQGVAEWNKYSVELGNGTKIFAAATTSDSIRGQSINCVGGYTKTCIIDDFGKIYHTNIKDVEFNNTGDYDHMSNTKLSSLKKYHLVYQTTNIENGKRYIGVHSTDNIDDGYLGTGSLMIKAIEKYGPSAFSRTVIKICETRDEAFELERLIVDDEIVKSDNFYNLQIGGGDAHNEAKELSRRSKLSKKAKGRKASPEAKLKMSKSRKDKSFSESHKAALSIALKGKPKPLSVIDKINKNPEKIRKTAEKHKGMKRTYETKLKMSVSAKNRECNTKGCIWITNGLINKMIDKSSEIPLNFKPGMTRGLFK